jgi:hypothetical protein
LSKLSLFKQGLLGSSSSLGLDCRAWLLVAAVNDAQSPSEVRPNCPTASRPASIVYRVVGVGGRLSAALGDSGVESRLVTWVWDLAMLFSARLLTVAASGASGRRRSSESGVPRSSDMPTSVCALPRSKLLRTCHGASEDLTAVRSLASGPRLSLGAILSIGQEEWRTAWTANCRCGAITGIDQLRRGLSVLRLFPPGAASALAIH